MSATKFLQGFVHSFLVHTEALEDTGGFALLLTDDGNENVLGADEFVLKAVGFGTGIG